MSIRSYIQLFMAAVLLTVSFSMDSHLPESLSAQVECNPIHAENQKSGTTNWQLTNPANDKLHQIKGYASETSINIGETIDFHISVDAPQTYTIDIYRMGWYGGLGGRLMMEVGPQNGIVQPDVTLDDDTGLIIAPWSRSYRLQIPEEWVTGVYLAKLTNANGFQNYIVFAVRDDSRDADILYQQAVTTDQAYNNYPDDKETGKSLYVSGSNGEVTLGGDKRAVMVSFDRPYAGDGAGLFFEWEHNLIRWLEREGYDVSYSTNLDTHLNGDRLKDFKAFLSAGHDEYWSKEMRDKVEEARDAGVSIAFFGANAAYEQIRFDDPDSRIITAYKNWNLDPSTDPDTKTVTWRQIYGREEQQLVGIQYISYNSWPDTNTDYVIENSDHWVYEGTGFVNGDTVPGIIGYEVDQLFEDVPLPEHISYDILSTSPYFTSYDTWVDAQSSIYQAPSGAWVFASGTLSWSWGLDRVGFEHEGLKKTTRNILNRFIGSSDGPCVDVVEPTATPVPPTPTEPPTNTPVPTNTPTLVPPTVTPAETPIPVATKTVVPSPTATESIPTAAPDATETPTPTATNTPEQSATVIPTSTPTVAGADEGLVIGRLFEDLNQNGIYDQSEPVLVGIEVHLIEQTTSGQSVSTSATTNDKGVYSFYNLRDSNYELTIDLPIEYVASGVVLTQISSEDVGQVSASINQPIVPLEPTDTLYLPVIN